MTKRLLSATLILAACSSAPPAAAPVPVPIPGRMLSYEQPADSSATYAFADSSWFNIKGGVIGDITANIATTGTAAIGFAPAAAGTRATIRITDLIGTFKNSAMEGGPNATEADISGPAVLTVSANGAVTVESMPTRDPEAERVGIGESFFRRFAVRLPARRVTPGAVWVDTISTTETTAGTKTTVNDIVTATFQRDTVINGRALALISTSTQRALTISGKSQGVDIAQELKGTSVGTILWDSERKLLVARTEKIDLAGTFSLPAMGLSGLPVTAGSLSRLNLR
jgi:hypothetical protein